jgi:hypothetical protein
MVRRTNTESSEIEPERTSRTIDLIFVVGAVAWWIAFGLMAWTMAKRAFGF